MKTIQNVQIRKDLWRLYAMIGALTGLFALAACSQMVQPTSTSAAAKAYVSNFKDNTVSVIDTAASKVVATVPVAAGPHGMVVSPDGSTVYVSGDAGSTVSVIDKALARREAGWTSREVHWE